MMSNPSSVRLFFVFISLGNYSQGMRTLPGKLWVSIMQITHFRKTFSHDGGSNNKGVAS